MCGADEPGDKLTGRINNEKVDINNGEKMWKKREPTKGNTDHPLGGQH
jgi:hypothetical protein